MVRAPSPSAESLSRAFRLLLVAAVLFGLVTAGFAVALATPGPSSPLRSGPLPVAHGAESASLSTTPAATIALNVSGVAPDAVGLTWTPTTSLLFSNYTVAFSTAGPSGPFTTAGVVTSQSTPQFAIDSLSPGATYWWQVTENSGLGGSSTSNVLAVQQPAVADLTDPVVTSTSVQVNWTDNATYGTLVSFSGFTLYEQVGGGSFQPVANFTNGSTRSTTVTGLSAGSGYSFYVETIDCLECGSASPRYAPTDSNVVTVGTVVALTASISVARTVVDVGEPDLISCTPAGGISPYTFAWSFAGSPFVSGNSTIASAFPSPTNESVGCRVTDHGGSMAQSATTVAVNAAPVLTPTLNRTSADVGEPIAFACNATGGTAPFSLEWTYGDGASLPGGAGSYAYPSAGTFTPTCSGVDAAGVTVAASGSVVVSPALQVAVQANTSRAAPGTVLGFTAVAHNGSSNYTGYAWSFGDQGTANGSSANHSFARPGNYSVSVRVTDSNGITASGVAPLVISYVALQVDKVPRQGSVGSPTDFSATATGGAGGPYNYSWAFGDGSVSYGASVTHTYGASGTYTVSLTVRDRLGAVNTTTWPAVSIGAGPGPLGGAPLGAFAAVGAAFGGVVTIVAFARTSSKEAGPEMLSRWIPPVGPRGAVQGSVSCSSCGAVNPSLRAACQVCGKPLPRGSRRR